MFRDIAGGLRSEVYFNFCDVKAKKIIFHRTIKTVEIALIKLNELSFIFVESELQINMSIVL